jgi:hypothetical protein
MSKGLRWILQFFLIALILVTLLVLKSLIVEGGTLREFVLFTSGLVVFSGLLWAAKFIGDAALNTEEFKAKFYSPNSPLVRWYRPIMLGLVLINIIASFISGPGDSTP